MKTVHDMRGSICEDPMTFHDASTAWRTGYQAWLAYPHMERELLAELKRCGETDARERFCGSLQFGTGGLRSVLGAGTNRMNVYSVAKASRGLAKYLLRESLAPSCAIAYDSRNKSEQFARLTAAVLAQEGVQAYIYPKLTPTPMLSYAVRHLRCDAGVVITASHNPAQYNGYKVYGMDGCQVADEAAEAIQSRIDREPDLPLCPLPQFDAFLISGKIQWIDGVVEEAYYASVLQSSLCKPEAPLHVVYSPLHGAGNIPVREVLARMENIKVTVVPQQEKPDGSFYTCPYPNPEEKDAMALAGALAQRTRADLFLATDPDCDRIGVGVRAQDGLRLLSGNELGILLLDFLCGQLRQKGAMPSAPVAIKTIVTTEMADAVARQHGVEFRNVLTGFKYIGKTIGDLERQGELERFVFGFEESCGFLSNTIVRDKDAVSTAMLVCEMAAYYKQQGKTLAQGLDILYARHGFSLNRQRSFEFEGMEGMERVRDIMAMLRGVEACILEEKIIRRVDYLSDETGLPRSDVLAFHLEGGSTITVRPSGTEPKLKFYFFVTAKRKENCSERMTSLCRKAEQWVAKEAYRHF